jgi:hypothetical protein
MTGRNYKIEHSEIRRSAGGQSQNQPVNRSNNYQSLVSSIADFWS